jgi:hypothetical protein
MNEDEDARIGTFLLAFPNNHQHQAVLFKNVHVFCCDKIKHKL